ncbi:MAG: histidine--tRNA ligase [Chloroflexi bacterium]|nr:histidine--tRNA ligase [Chloroflexota bacterium]
MVDKTSTGQESDSSGPLRIQPVKGTRDFYPEKMRLRNWLLGKMRSVSERYGYEEYDGPFLEPFELYAAKSGDEIVNEQMYILLDRGGRKLGIRPEMTPTLARMVAQKQAALMKPVKWYSVPACWRYERPQKGRVREFWQYNIDILGVESMEADAEIIAVGVDLFRSLAFTPDEVYIRINNRKFMQSALTSFGIDADKIERVYKAIDKKERWPAQDYQAYLRETGLNERQMGQLEELLSASDLSHITLRNEGYDELSSLFHYLDLYGVSEFCAFDPTVVRGLAYYTGTVFEAFDRDREFRSIIGGGRYDNLVETFGGGKLPGTGFGAGDVVLELVLAKYDKLPILEDGLTAFIANYSFTEKPTALRIAADLRKKGVNVETNLMDVGLDKQLRYAGRRAARLVVIVAPAELEQGQVAVRDMVAREQVMVPLDAVVDYVRDKAIVRRA